MLRQFPYHFFNFIRAFAGSNQTSIISLHHDKVVHPEERDVFILRAEDDIIRAVYGRDLSIGLVAIALRIEMFCHRDPRTHIVPVEGCFNVEDP